MIVSINIVADNLFTAQSQATALADLMYRGRAKPMGWACLATSESLGEITFDTEFKFEVAQ